MLDLSIHGIKKGDFEMKKLLAILLVLALMLPMLVACDNNKAPDGSQETQANKKPTPKPDDDEDAFDITELLPEYLNYNKTEVVLCVRGGMTKEIGLMEDDGEALTAELFERTARTEERLNVVLAIDEIEGWETYNSGVARIRNNISTNQSMWDIVVGWSPRIPQIAAENLYYNLLDFDYFDASNIWWSQSLAKELTINNRMFMASGDVSTNYLVSAHAVYFNQTLAKAMDMDYTTFYKTVSSGKWTFDELYNLSKDAYSDKNGDTIVNDGDQFGLLIISTWLQAFYTAAGINMIPNDGETRPEFNVNVTQLEQVFSKVQILVEAQSTKFYEIDTEYDYGENFRTGNALFYLTTLGSLKDMTEMTDGFGVLPVPKYDEAQTNYYTQLHSCELWSIPKDAEDPEMSSAVMTSMGYDSHEVVLEPHFEKLLKTRYVKDSESGYMIDTIYYNIYMNFDSIYNEVLQPGTGVSNKEQMPMFYLGAVLKGYSGSATAWWTANQDGLKKELEKILVGFYE